MERMVIAWIIAPIIFLIGIAVAGAFIEDLFHIPNAAILLFTAVGGIGAVAGFFALKSRINNL